MNIKKTIVFIAVFIIAVTVFASDAGHSQEVHHGFDWFGFLGKVFNSTVLFGGLYYALRKPIASFLGKKSADVKEDILERENKIKEAREELSGILKRLESIADQVKIMNEDAKKSGAEEKDKLRIAGEEESKRIIEAAKEEVDFKIESSVKGLMTRIAKLTIDKFRDTFTNELTEKVHEKIIEDNIKIAGDIMGSQVINEAKK